MKKSNESPTLKIKKAEKKRSKKLKKLEKLREPLILTKEEQDRIDELKSRPIIAWWDFENLSYPWVGVYKMILNKLRREGYTGKLELHAIVGYKGDKEPKQDKTFTMHYGDLNPSKPFFFPKLFFFHSLNLYVLMFMCVWYRTNQGNQG